MALAFTRNRDADRIILGILAVFWAWMGGVYHIGFFSRINPASYVFGVLFVVQGALLAGAITGIGTSPIRFEFRSGLDGLIGGGLIFYAMLVYLILGGMNGHGYPYAPLFGVAPCPTTIFTFGIFLWTRRVPLGLIAIPFLWSLIGTTAAIYLGVPEDWGLGVAGLLGGARLLYGTWRSPLRVRRRTKPSSVRVASTSVPGSILL